MYKAEDVGLGLKTERNSTEKSPQPLPLKLSSAKMQPVYLGQDFKIQMVGIVAEE